MRFRRRWRLRAWMALIAVVALLMPGAVRIFRHWTGYQMRSIVVTGSQRALNPALFRKGVLKIDLRNPRERATSELVEQRLKERGIAYRTE